MIGDTMTDLTMREQDWRIRLYIYERFAATGRPPACAATARRFAISTGEARHAYRRLHQQHALFLEPGTDDVRMANPLSAVPTPYRVHVHGRWLWANCAWDSLGIPAMLHADARIEAAYAGSHELTTYAIENGQLQAESGVVHFPMPFRRWYDDLIHT